MLLRDRNNPTNLPTGPYAKNMEPLGTKTELDELELDTSRVPSCGEPTLGVARCRWADACALPCKGKEGKRRVVALDAQLVPIMTDGKARMIERAAGGPHNALVMFKHPGSAAVWKVMPCYRFFDHKRRWDNAGVKYQIRAWEGDGQIFNMRETKRETNAEGKVVAVQTTVPRAIPFHPRPDEALVGRRDEVEMERAIRERELRETEAELSQIQIEVPHGGSSGGSAGPGSPGPGSRNRAS